MPAISDLERALRSTNLPFALFGWDHAPTGNYGVFSPDRRRDLLADGDHVEYAISGTVDWFTRSPGNGDTAAIEAALQSVGAWSLESIQYEEDTRYTHYEWSFGIYG